jgi:3',5'-cyclic AMP phosphodiesterase CpdA
MTFSSCVKDYGMDEFIARENDVNARSTNITDVPIPVKNPEFRDYLTANHPLISVPDPLPSKYNVLILSDIHFGANSDHPDLPLDKFRAWLAPLKEANDTSVPVEQRKPLFCLCLGDSVESGAKSEYKDFARFITDELESKGIPVYSILGNHDHLNNGWVLWKEKIKPHTTYYRFKTKTFSWYFLDTASGTMGASQMRDFVKNAKADPNPKLVFTHYPIYGGGGNFYFSLSDPHERALLIDTFAKTKVKLVAEGHQHTGSSHNFGSFQEKNVSAFRDEGSWHILTVNEPVDDENAATVSIVERKE